MKIPLSWLKDYVDITTEPDALANRLTLAGMEVESVTTIGELWDRDRVFVGQAIAVTPHPDAERLVLVRVEYGASVPLTVVTGAPNMRPYVGQDLSDGSGPKVAFAIAGARLVDGHSEERRIAKLKPGKIRGIVSEGMVCSEKELDLSDEHEGILVLPTDAPVGQPLVDYLGDVVLEFDIKGAFGHLQSVTGIAREVAALTGQPFRYPVVGLMLGNGEPKVVAESDFTKIRIDAPDLCLRYSAALIEGLTVGPSPLWMQQRLLRAGMRPISNIVDVTNYVMLEMGQPLHAFDYDLLAQRAGGVPTIIMRRARPGEHLVTLDGIDRALDPDMLMITDTAGTIAVGGVMGGSETEIHDGTTRVLLEAANFDFLSIRRTSQMLKLSSEAGARFGKGVDPDLTLRALTRSCELLTELGGGMARLCYADVYPGKPAPRTIRLDPSYVRRLLGISIPEEDMVRILQALEFTVNVGGSGQMEVGVPSHRLDVNIAADLVEEIGRIYGYDRLPMTLLEDELPTQYRNSALEAEEQVRDVMVGSGLDEIISYSIIDIADDARLSKPAGPSSAPDPKNYVKVLNPLTADRSYLRRTLLPSLLKTAGANLRFLDRVASFELGRVFERRPSEILPAEPRRLGAVMIGEREPATWLGHGAEQLGFFDLKGVVEVLIRRFGIRDTSWEKGSQPGLHPGRTAQLMLRGEVAGVIGELHPIARDAFDLPNVPVAVMELDLEVLLADGDQTSAMHGISVQPAVYEDVALVVDETVPAAQVETLIRQSGGKLLDDVRLFDVYRGKPIPAGKKSLAYALTFQAPDRTLTDDEVQKLRSKIVARLERELGAALRA